MVLHLRDPATDAAVRRLAKLKRKSPTETIREAVEHECELARKAIPFLYKGDDFSQTDVAVT